MPEWLTVFSPLAACVAMMMAFRLIFREKAKDHAATAAERRAELEAAAVLSEKRGASNTELAHGMAALRTALTGVTAEISGLKALATEVLKVGIGLQHVQAAVDDIKEDMKLLADAERVHVSIDEIERRLRDLEQHMAKWSGKFAVTGTGAPKP